MVSYRNSKPDQSGQPLGESVIRKVHVFITGRVQGVFFRAETKKQALESGLTGWVRNLRDNRVEAVFEGPGSEIAKMLDWCKKGPTLARVSGVEITEESRPAGTRRVEDFRIVYNLFILDS
ncbi:MAG: acylphosphatase [Thermodesulfobacteriota bacterium]|nr:acylphosphatase [Thermodesulfobacteriota bacterium]